MSCSALKCAARATLAAALALACIPAAAFAADNAEGESTPAAITDTSATTTVDSEALATLTDNLTSRFATSGDYSQLVSVVNGDGYSYISSVFADAAVALYQQGKGAQIDTSSVIANYSMLSGAGQLAKAALILTASGADCTNIQIDGVTHNVFTDIESALEQDGQLTTSVYDNVYILPAYALAGQSLDTELSARLIDAVLATQVTDSADACYGLFGTMSEWNGVIYDSHGVQVTAQAILALLPYSSRPEVATAIQLASAAIDKLQNADGSYNEGYGFNAYISIDSTASVVAAYMALGKEAEAACAFLLAEASESNNAGYDNSQYSYVPQLTGSTALMGLVAYQRASEMGGTYNVVAPYIATPVKDSAPSATPEEPAVQPVVAQTASTETTAGTELAATGDAEGEPLALASLSAIGALSILGAVSAAQRARRKADRRA